MSGDLKIYSQKSENIEHEEHEKGIGFIIAILAIVKVQLIDFLRNSLKFMQFYPDIR